MSDINVEYGTAETFWDAFLSPKLCKRVDVDHEEMSHISVCIDPTTGEVSLNRGYEEHSPQGKAEGALWAEYSEQIEDELYATLRNRKYPEYEAFVARKAGGASAPAI